MDLPKVCQKEPYVVDVEADKKYFWCTCGLSTKQPFCDGSHKGTDMKSCHYTPEASGTVYLCGCKHTKTPPFCDGSHNGL